MVRAIFRRGPSFLFLYIKESLVFDLINGTNTHLRVPKSEQVDGDKERGDGVLYVASLTSVVRRTLEVSRIILGERRFQDAQFFDLGCGKGKALLIYAMEYSKGISSTAIGIEYEPTLCKTAQLNLDRIKNFTKRVEVHCDSALNIETYIRSGTIIVYLYNPFKGETLNAVLSSIAKYPHVLIYVDPVQRNILSSYGYHIHTFFQGKHHANTWLVASSGLVVDARSGDKYEN
jgi:SAM-dependent methyltransferase